MMAFKSDAQRKAVMAKLTGNRVKNIQGAINLNQPLKKIEVEKLKTKIAVGLVGLRNKAGFVIDSHDQDLIRKRLNKKELSEFKKIFKEKPFTAFRAVQEVEFNRKSRLGIITLAEVRRENKKSGSFFFSKDTMKFFDSRVETKGNLIKNKYFITSEQFHGTEGSQPRKYTIRQFDVKNPKNIETVGSFNTVKSLGEAIKIAKSLR